MTDRELMQQALEALEEISGGYSQNLIVALRDRLAQPEQKPYAWMAVGGTIWRHKATEDDTPIYTHPPQRKPLTDDEIEAALLSVDPMTKRLPPGMKAFARAIEAAHGIKEKT